MSRMRILSKNRIPHPLGRDPWLIHADRCDLLRVSDDDRGAVHQQTTVVTSHGFSRVDCLAVFADCFHPLILVKDA